MTDRTLLLIASLFLFAACGGDDANTTASSIKSSPRYAMDWAGTYYGTLPCEGCVGIGWELQLDSAGTYKMTTQELGRSQELKITSGKFQWDDTGKNLILESATPVRLAVAEGELYLLDANAQRMPSDVAPRYTLRKDGMKVQGGVEDTYWQLKELNGGPVASATGRRPVHLRLNSSSGQVHGYTGCRGFVSTYELDTEKGLLRFSSMGFNEKDCADGSTEPLFARALGSVTHYVLADTMLAMQDANGQVFMRFSAGIAGGR